MPTTTKIAVNKMLGKIKLLSQNSAKPSGINDKKEIVSITPLAKSKEPGIIFSALSLETKIGMIPIIVDNPANVVIKKLTIIEFILNNMKKRNKQCINTAYFFIYSFFSNSGITSLPRDIK